MSKKLVTKTDKEYRIAYQLLMNQYRWHNLSGALTWVEKAYKCSGELEEERQKKNLSKRRWG